MLVGALALTAAFEGGCAVENPDHVEDTTGVEMGWGCVNGNCSTIQETFSPLPPDCAGEDTELLVGAGGLAILCAVSRGPEGEDIVHQTTCRPLVCADELDCPQWSDRPYACVEELCQTSLALDAVDIMSLCLWDVPRHDSCAEAGADPMVRERLALVTGACDDDDGCRVPAACLQP